MGNKWITLDYLELFCQHNRLVVGCRNDDGEVWISPLGPHPTSLTAEEVRAILTDSALFEVRAVSDDDSPPVDSRFLTRPELEQRIRQMMN
jgi:hypothetical protein